MKNLFFALILAIFSTLATAQNDTSTTYLKSLEQRLSDLERQQRESELWYNEYYVLSKNRMTPFLGEKISFGGFFETNISHMGGPDTQSQTSANSNALGLNIAAEFNDQFRLVTQQLTVLNYPLQNPHNNPALTQPQRQFGNYFFGSYVAHAYLEYQRSETFILQTGLGYVPFGAAFQQREPFLSKNRQGHLMVHASDTSYVRIAFPLWMGVHASGAFELRNSRVGYNVYTFSPPTNTKTLGAGSRIWWSNSHNLTLGTSIQTGEQATNYFYSYGFDVTYKYMNYEFATEYARNVGSGGVPSIESYYFEPSVEFADGEWVLYAIFDYLKNPLYVDGVTADGFEKSATGAGVNWLPIPNVRFRFGGARHDYLGETAIVSGQNRDYFLIDLSAGIAF